MNRLLAIPTLIILVATVAGAFDIQGAIDANPGGVIVVPPGEHTIRESLRITSDRTVLKGYGTIIQEDPAAYVLIVDQARDVRVQDLTFTRAEGAQEAEVGGIRLDKAHGAVLDGIRVLDCKAQEAAIAIYNSTHCVVRDSEIRNYKRIAIDDRTETELLGYAFHAIDGTGLRISRSQHVMISRNRIIEDALLPTREVQEAHSLGDLTEGRIPTNPGKLGMAAVEAGYVSNWHQGSAILVANPRDTRFVQVMDNQIINAAQGIDLHCDYTLVSGNQIDYCMIGIKATHGCEGLAITGNTITHVDLWGILLNPGASSAEDNPDRGILVANNAIMAYGHGHEYWNWGGAHENGGDSFAIMLFDGQLAENPPLREVLITGNIVGGNIGPPRYRYAVCIGSWHGPAEDSPNMPVEPVFTGNLLTPGLDGVSNVDLPGLR